MATANKPRFDLNGFINDLTNRGVLRTHTFEVNIPIPGYLADMYSEAGGINIRCESAQMPGLTLAEAQSPPRYGYGPTEFNPYGIIHDNVSLTFLLDKKSLQYAFFYDWMGVIVNPDNASGLDAEKTYNRNGNFRAYEVGYKQNYAVDMTVTMYDEEHTAVQYVTLYQAFPRAINALDLNWQNQDQLAKVVIPFTYRDYKIEFPKFKSNNQ